MKKKLSFYDLEFFKEAKWQQDNFAVEKANTINGLWFHFVELEINDIWYDLCQLCTTDKKGEYTGNKEICYLKDNEFYDSITDKKISEIEIFLKDGAKKYCLHLNE